MEKACDSLINDNLPIVFLDTCVYLNLLNSFYQKNLPDNYVNACLDIMHLHKKNCYMLTCTKIVEEFDRNIDTVTDNLRKEIVKSHDTINNTVNFINHFHSSTLSIPSEQILSASVTGIMKKTAFGLLNIGGLIPHDGEHLKKAMERIMELRAPSRKGKAEPGDCLIIEVFFDLCHRLRQRGFTQKIAFITYNKDDFGTHGSLKEPLNHEFEQYGADFYSDINHLVHDIK